MKNIRRFGLSAAGIAAISATVALAAPFAAADTSSNGMTVVGTNFTTGTAYTINIITGVPGVTADVYDNVGGSTVAVGSATSSGSTTASVQWTPATSGSHHLWVVLTGGSQSVPTSGPVDVTVSDPSTTTTTGTGSASTLIPLISNLLGSLGGNNASSVG